MGSQLTAADIVIISALRTIKEFDPDQPRDEGGKWTSGGGGTGGERPDTREQRAADAEDHMQQNAWPSRREYLDEGLGYVTDDTSSNAWVGLTGTIYDSREESHDAEASYHLERWGESVVSSEEDPIGAIGELADRFTEETGMMRISLSGNVVGVDFYGAMTPEQRSVVSALSSHVRKNSEDEEIVLVWRDVESGNTGEGIQTLPRSKEFDPDQARDESGLAKSNADWIRQIPGSQQADLAASEEAAASLQSKSRRKAAIHVMHLAAHILAGNAHTLKAKRPRERARERITQELEAARKIYRKYRSKTRKEFDPDQPRDEGGKWTSGSGGEGSGSRIAGEFTASNIAPGSRVFHGTSQEYVESIIRDGLQPHKDVVSDRPASVYFTASMDQAHAYGEGKAGQLGSESYVILELRVPAGMEILQDEYDTFELGQEENYRSESSFSWNDIYAIQIYDTVSGELTKTISGGARIEERRSKEKIEVAFAVDFIAPRKEKQLSGEGQPEPLGSIIDDFIGSLKDLTGDLEANRISTADWEDEFERLIARYHTAGLMAGADTEDLGRQEVGYLTRLVGSQYEYLDNFAVDIQSAEEWAEGWATRAESYALAIKVPYWGGNTELLPLPAMPAEGTQCLNNCGCEWEIEIVNEDNGDYDCYWRRGKEDSCQTCLEREEEWSPVLIRGFELQ